MVAPLNGAVGVGLFRHPCTTPLRLALVQEPGFQRHGGRGDARDRVKLAPTTPCCSRRIWSSWVINNGANSRTSLQGTAGAATEVAPRHVCQGFASTRRPDGCRRAGPSRRLAGGC